MEPKIYLFHDFVSEREIERLKELAIPRVSIPLILIIVCCYYYYTFHIADKTNELCIMLMKNIAD